MSHAEASLRAEIDELRRQNQELKASSAFHASEAMKYKAEIEQMRGGSSAEVQSIWQEVNQIRQLVQTIAAEKDEVEKELRDFRESVSKQQGIIDAATEVIESLGAGFRAVARSVENHTEGCHYAEVDGMNESIKSVSDVIESKPSSFPLSSMNAEEAAALRAEVEELKLQRQELRALNAYREVEAAKLKDEVQEIQGKLKDEAKDKNEKIERLNKSFMDQVTSVQEKHWDAFSKKSSEMHALQEKLKRAEADLSKKDNELDVLKRKVKKAEEEVKQNTKLFRKPFLVPSVYSALAEYRPSPSLLFNLAHRISILWFPIALSLYIWSLANTFIEVQPWGSLRSTPSSSSKAWGHLRIRCCWGGCSMNIAHPASAQQQNVGTCIHSFYSSVNALARATSSLSSDNPQRHQPPPRAAPGCLRWLIILLPHAVIISDACGVAVSWTVSASTILPGGHNPDSNPNPLRAENDELRRQIQELRAMNAYHAAESIRYKAEAEQPHLNAQVQSIWHQVEEIRNHAHAQQVRVERKLSEYERLVICQGEMIEGLNAGFSKVMRAAGNFADGRFDEGQEAMREAMELVSEVMEDTRTKVENRHIVDPSATTVVTNENAGNSAAHQPTPTEQSQPIS
ncbi:hypothetical protein NMY22_g967 [Coprinellus aureogranulatus]|nr:hypothetical protein NMY22_g967 [Coprinellus aureogranulatus]